jgi:hypothetical protein
VARWCRCSLSVAGPFVCRCLTSFTVLRYHIPLIEPDRRISRIRLSEKSRFRPRKAGGAYARRASPRAPWRVVSGYRLDAAPRSLCLKIRKIRDRRFGTRRFEKIRNRRSKPHLLSCGIAWICAAKATFKALTLFGDVTLFGLRRDRRTNPHPCSWQTVKSRDDEVTKRHHGYQRIPSVLETAQKTVLLWK